MIEGWVCVYRGKDSLDVRKMATFLRKRNFKDICTFSTMTKHDKVAEFKVITKKEQAGIVIKLVQEQMIAQAMKRSVGI